jgi:hypothetical protein
LMFPDGLLDVLVVTISSDQWSILKITVFGRNVA